MIDNSDLAFQAVYNRQILNKIEQRFGPFSLHHVDLTITTAGMLDLMAKMNQKPRRGEVVMVIRTETNQIWLHTKPFYPTGVYRLMTGGLEMGEKPSVAFRREVTEETGFKPKIDRCLAVITYTLRHQTGAQPFVSYVFSTRPISGTPSPADPSEAISDFKAVPVAALPEITQRLQTIEGAMADWGKFRAVAHQIVYAQLQNE